LYFWRIDSVNDDGVTEGDEWYFATIVFYPPIPSWNPVDGGNGQGPPGVDDPPGIEGTDWVWSGLNNMITIRRLVAVAKGTLYYET